MKVRNLITVVITLNILLLTAELVTSSRVLKSQENLSESDSTSSHPQNVNDWYNGNSSERCIRLHAIISVKFNADNSIQNEDVPQSAVSTGSCNSEQQFIELVWTTEHSNGSEDANFTLTMSFQNQTNKYSLENITLEWKATTGNFSGYHTMINISKYETPLNSSYKCKDEIKIKAHDFTIKFRELQFQAFFSFPNDTVAFSQAKECPNIGHAVLEMMGLLVGCLFVFFIIAGVFCFVLKRLRPIEFGYLNVN